MLTFKEPHTMETEELLSIKKQEEKLYTDVEKISFKELINKTPPKGKEFVIMDVKNKAMLSFCSKDYKLRKNSTIYQSFEKLLKEHNINFKKEINISQGTKFYVNYIILEPIQSKSIPDLLPVINIWNSYDGTVKTQIHFGYKKLVCGNILTRPNDCCYHRSSKHSTSEEEFTEYNVPHFLDMYLKFVKEIKSDLKLFEKLYKKEADKKTFDKIFTKLKLHPNTRDIALIQLQKELDGGFFYDNLQGDIVKYEGSTMNLFLIYNSLNYAIYHSNNKELPDFKCRRNKKLTEIILKLS